MEEGEGPPPAPAPAPAPAPPVPEGRYDHGLSCTPDTWWITLFVIILMSAVTLWPFITMMLYEGKDIVLLLFAITLLLLTNANYVIFQMCQIAISPTISHTVAQRFHPVAYYAIISMCALIYYTIGIVGAGFVGQRMSAWDWAYACLEMFGLISISLILVFPAEFDAGRNQVLFDRTVNTLHLDPRNWYSGRTTFTAAPQAGTKHISFIKVFDCEPSTSHLLHNLFVFVGYVALAFAIASYLVNNYSHEWYQIGIIFSAGVSLIAIVVFFILGILNYPWGARIPLALEVIGLYYAVFAVLLMAFGAGNLVPHYDY